MIALGGSIRQRPKVESRQHIVTQDESHTRPIPPVAASCYRLTFLYKEAEKAVKGKAGRVSGAIHLPASNIKP